MSLGEDGVRRLTTFCIMSVGGDELFWHWVSDMRCQFGGDNLGVAVEEQDGQRPGDAPRTPDWMASGRQVKCAAGGGGDGDRIGGERVGPLKSRNPGEVKNVI